MIETVRNALIVCGIFWLSSEMVVPCALVAGKLTAGIVYPGSIWGAIAMGILTSLGRSVTAVLASVLVTLLIAGKKQQRWVFFLAGLYIVAIPIHYSGPAANAWNQLWRETNLWWPAIVCIAAGYVTAYLRDRGVRSKAGAVV